MNRRIKYPYYVAEQNMLPLPGQYEVRQKENDWIEQVAKMDN